MSVWSIYEDGWDGYNYEESDRDDVLLKLNAIATSIADKMSKKYPEHTNLIYNEASAAANEYNSDIDGAPYSYIHKRVLKAIGESRNKQKQEAKQMENEKVRKAAVANRFKNPIPDSVKASVIADYAKGMTRKELAEEYKIGASSVSRILKAAGNAAVGEEAPASRTKDTPREGYTTCDFPRVNETMPFTPNEKETLVEDLKSTVWQIRCKAVELYSAGEKDAAEASLKMLHLYEKLIAVLAGGGRRE